MTHHTNEAMVYAFLRRFRNAASVPELARLTCLTMRQVDRSLRALQAKGYVQPSAVIGWWGAVDPLRDLQDPDYAAIARIGVALRWPRKAA